ncbi:MAG: FtsH protease activity modulator HflK [Zetaproteobacteria bacterium]|nr:FtsH protease activity modulator HflK [Zetaproteobacteria bacterium]
MSNDKQHQFEKIMDDLHQSMHKMAGGPKKASSGSEPPKRSTSSSGGKMQWLLGVLLFTAYVLATSFYKIDTTQRGVITRFGAYYGIADEGPHFKIPFGIDHVYKVEVTRVHEEQFGFRKGEKISAERARVESLMLTGDLKVAVVEWSLQYRIHNPKKFLFNAVRVDKNIRDISISVMRRVVGDKLVTDVLTTDRISIAQVAKKLTQETLDRFDMGVLITNLNLQNVTPPEMVRDAFNEVNIAKQEADQLINQAKGNYNKVIPKAEGLANQHIDEAKAYAVEKVNHALGNAERFNKVLLSYKKAPLVTKQRLYLEAMEELLGKSQGVTVIDKSLQGLLPLMPLDPKGLNLSQQSSSLPAKVGS